MLNLNKNKKYLLACSYGPDSMALLDAAIKEKIDIVVAHVNYHRRDASNAEEKSLLKYCLDRGIQIEVLDTSTLKVEGNFQEWARETRYKFFNDVCKKYGRSKVLVAHQEDDLIETYLMQKKRGNIVKNPGIAYKNIIFGVEVIRPLLGYSKASLLDYDIENDVPYSIDESNLTDHYTRNVFRHHIVETMTQNERENVLNEISNLEKKSYDFVTKIKYKDFILMDYENIVFLLDKAMNKLNEHRDLSNKFINEIKKQFSNKTNLEIMISSNLVLEKDYNYVYLVNLKKVKDYKFFINGKFKNRFIDIDFSDGAKDRNILDLSGIFIKNTSPNELYRIKDYEVKIRRLYIDWKMPLYLRKIWPGIYDETGKLIYIPRYREKYLDNHKSKLKINTDFFINF